MYFPLNQACMKSFYIPFSLTPCPSRNITRLNVSRSVSALTPLVFHTSGPQIWMIVQLISTLAVFVLVAVPTFQSCVSTVSY